MNGSTAASSGGPTVITASLPAMRGVEYRCGDCGARNMSGQRRRPSQMQTVWFPNFVQDKDKKM
ncbi:hypothetical protein THAOC_14413, partial [Thalassiosira oceanica]